MFLSPFIIFTSPDLFQEATFFQIIDEAVIINFFRLFSNRGAAFAGEVDGFGDGFAWDDHRAVEDFPSVNVVGGLYGLGVSGAHGFADRRFGRVGIFLDEVDDLGQGCDHALDDIGTIAQHFITGVERAVDERQIQIDQAIHHIVTFVFGADVERWRNDYTVDDTGGHRLITLALAAAHGADRGRVVRQAEFFHDCAREPVAQVSRTRDTQGFALEVLRPPDLFSGPQDIRQLHQW